MSDLTRQLASLHGDPALEHRWLCHPERPCEDGCNAAPIPERQRVYDAYGKSLEGANELTAEAQKLGLY